MPVQSIHRVIWQFYFARAWYILSNINGLENLLIFVISCTHVLEKNRATHATIDIILFAPLRYCEAFSSKVEGRNLPSSSMPGWQWRTPSTSWGMGSGKVSIERSPRIGLWKVQFGSLHFLTWKKYVRETQCFSKSWATRELCLLSFKVFILANLASITPSSFSKFFSSPSLPSERMLKDAFHWQRHIFL